MEQVQQQEQQSLTRGKGLAREVFIVAFGYLIYSQVRGLAGDRVADAFENAQRLISIEKSLGIFGELALQAYIVPHDALVEIFNYIYFLGFFPLVLPTAVWLFVRRPEIYLLARNAFLISGAIAACSFVLIPTAPPRLLDIGFIDTLGRSLTPTYDSIPGVNHFAAVPSMHVGWNFLTALALYLALDGRRYRALVLILPVLMFTSTVATGNHYFLDGVLGVLTAGVSYVIALKLNQFVRRRSAARAAKSGAELAVVGD